MKDILIRKNTNSKKLGGAEKLEKISEEELISEMKWYKVDLDSDDELQESKRRYLEESKYDDSEILKTFKFPSAAFEEPLSRNSPRLLLKRKILAASGNKKQLQRIHEAIPEGAALVKTIDSTLTIKVPGQQDTLLKK